MYLRGTMYTKLNVIEYMVLLSLQNSSITHDTFRSVLDFGNFWKKEHRNIKDKIWNDSTVNNKRRTTTERDINLIIVIQLRILTIIYILMYIKIYIESNKDVKEL